MHGLAHHVISNRRNCRSHQPWSCHKEQHHLPDASQHSIDEEDQHTFDKCLYFPQQETVGCSLGETNSKKHHLQALGNIFSPYSQVYNTFLFQLCSLSYPGNLPFYKAPSSILLNPCRREEQISTTGLLKGSSVVLVTNQALSQSLSEFIYAKFIRHKAVTSLPLQRLLFRHA